MAGEKSFFRNLSKPVDLTKGSPWKVLLLYGAPIMLSYFLQQIYVLTDAIICGQTLTAGQVAGVNDTFPLTFIFLQFAFGCTSGFSVITAKRVGLKDERAVRKSFATQIYLTVAVSIVLTVLSIILLPWLLSVINVTPTNKEVYDAAYSYCFVIFLGIITQMGYNFVCGILRAYGDSLTPLVFLVISTAINVALDVFFLAVLKSGPAGAAAATVITQFLSMAGCFIYTMIKYKSLRLKKEDFKCSANELISHLKQGLPLGLQFSILAIGIIVMQGGVVKFDIDKDGIMLPLAPAQNGFGAAILGFNAQNYGKGNYETIKKGTLQALIITLVIYVLCLGAGFALSIGGAYQYIFMSAEKITAESIRFGNIFVYVDFALYFMLGVLIVVRSAVQGICKSGFVLGAGIMELTARILICIFLPSIINGGAISSSASSAAFAGLCFADPGAWTLASLLLLIPLFKNIIRKKY